MGHTLTLRRAGSVEDADMLLGSAEGAEVRH
jgi:hypothetical protein